jgi:hypothetical protein
MNMATCPRGLPPKIHETETQNQVTGDHPATSWPSHERPQIHPPGHSMCERSTSPRGIGQPAFSNIEELHEPVKSIQAISPGPSRAAGCCSPSPALEDEGSAKNISQINACPCPGSLL